MLTLGRANDRVFSRPNLQIVAPSNLTDRTIERQPKDRTGGVRKSDV